MADRLDTGFGTAWKLVLRTAETILWFQRGRARNARPLPAGPEPRREGMSVTTRDIFGAAGGAQPAKPDSYGEAPRGSWRLPDETRLGPVRLQVADLERSLRFYQEVLGLRILNRGSAHSTLAAHGDDGVLVELVERRGAIPAGGRPRLGLFHFAILLPDRASLARLVRHLRESGVGPGAGDHLVSEAFYLSDPDGLGIELYADRPRSTWRRVGRELMISTEPLDVEDLLRAGGDEPWRGIPAGTMIGHVHLHVGNIEEASAFFSDAVGFDRITWSYPGALFLGAGGYHHHLGTNTWAGSAAQPPGEGDARLLAWTIELPDGGAVAEAERSLTGAGHPVERISEEEISTEDPWGTPIRLRLSRLPGGEG
jgi:catechol 2,3-dioxygenase